MRELVLHIGFPKTATKTLQFFLFKKHNDLNYFGRFPNREKSHHSLIDDVLNLSDDEFKKKFDYLKTSLATLNFVSDKTNLISDEFFLLHDFIYDIIKLEKSIGRIKKLCQSNHIKLKILVSFRNQHEIIRSIYVATFQGSYKSTVENLILALNNKQSDLFTSNFLNIFNYNKLYNTILKIVEKNNVHILFYEELKVSQEEYYINISKILNIDSKKSINLCKDKKSHLMEDLIKSDLNITSLSEFIFYKIKRFSFKNYLNKEIFFNSLINLLTRIKNLKLSRKEVLKNKKNLNLSISIIDKNKHLIKKYYENSNKEFFENLAPNYKKFKDHYV